MLGRWSVSEGGAQLAPILETVPVSAPARSTPLVLVVEDDAILARDVERYLEANGFEVEIESRGDRAPERIAALTPDLVVLDVMLPGSDGLAVCRTVRPSYRGPILMLTALGDEVDEVAGLEVGADDYLTKPVRPRVLLARVRTLLRRAGSAAADTSEGSVVVVGDLEIDPERRVAHRGGRELALTTLEFDLLHMLARHAGTVVSRDELCRRVRGVGYDGIDRSIDLGVHHLRLKLGDDGKHPALIKSVRGVGYQLAKSK